MSLFIFEFDCEVRCSELSCPGYLVIDQESSRKSELLRCTVMSSLCAKYPKIVYFAIFMWFYKEIFLFLLVFVRFEIPNAVVEREQSEVS